MSNASEGMPKWEVILERSDLLVSHRVDGALLRALLGRDRQVTPRVAPSLEKKRETSKAKSQAKSEENAAQKRAAERSRTYVRLFDAAGREIEPDPIVAREEDLARGGFTRFRRRSPGTGVSGHQVTAVRSTSQIGNKDASLEGLHHAGAARGRSRRSRRHHGHDKIWRQVTQTGAKVRRRGLPYGGHPASRYDDMDPYVTEAAEDRSQKEQDAVDRAQSSRKTFCDPPLCIT